MRHLINILHDRVLGNVAAITKQFLNKKIWTKPFTVNPGSIVFFPSNLKTTINILRRPAPCKHQWCSLISWMTKSQVKVANTSKIPITLAACSALLNLASEISQFDVEDNIGHLMTLARIALEKGEIEKAEAILEMGIKICEEYHTYFAMPYMYDILASIAFAMGNYDRAEFLLVEIIEKMVQLGAPEYDSQIVDFKLRLSRIYSTYNENILAEIGFRNCLKTQQMKIEKGDTSTKTGMLYVNTMFWYSLHKIKNKDFKTAKKLIDDAYSYSVKIKGISPYQEMIILYTLADLNTQLEHYDIALQNMQGAILLGKGIGSLDLPKCYLKLGKIYIKLGSQSIAERWLAEASALAELFNDREVYEDAEQTLKGITDGEGYTKRTTSTLLDM